MLLSCRTSLVFRSLAACSAALLAACGGSAPATQSSSTAPTASVAATDPPPNDTNAVTAPTSPDDLLPAADPSTYVGTNQVVHLAVLPDGTAPALDIWARRSFEYAPILLVEGLEYGELSPVYGAPEGMSVAAVESGAGPDATPFAEVFSAGDDEQYTHLVVYDNERDAGTGLLLTDADPQDPNAFPAANPGQALVRLYAYQLLLNPLAVGTGFEQRIAGVETSFQVGMDGTEGCAPQPRLTDQGYSPAVLGGTQYVMFDLEPGDTTFSFHGWGSANQECADPSVIEPVTISVAAGDRAWVLLHSRDGQTIDALVVPTAEQGPMSLDVAGG